MTTPVLHPSDTPALPDRAPETPCRDCGDSLRYDPERYAWQHVGPGADHAPRPTVRRKERTS